MAGDRSFTDYVKSRFLDDLYPAAEEYVEQNWEGLDLDLRSIHQVGGVAMTDMTIKFVSVSDLPDLKIEFDVVVDAEIEITEGDYHYDEYDICNQWLSFRCTGDLATNLDDFKITSITPYQKGNARTGGQPNGLPPARGRTPTQFGNNSDNLTRDRVNCRYGG